MEGGPVNSRLRRCVWRNSCSTVSLLWLVFIFFFFYFYLQSLTICFRIFELAPNNISLFGLDAQASEKEVSESEFCIPSVSEHVKDVVNKLETALRMMMNEELGALAETLGSLRWRHVREEVNPSHYVLLELAFLRTLEITLKDCWTRQVQKDWAAVINFITQGMMIGADKDIKISRQERILGELSVATFSLTILMPQSNSSTTVSSSSSSGDYRFQPNIERNEKSSSDPPKPASRSMFHGFFNDSLPCKPTRNSENDLRHSTNRDSILEQYQNKSFGDLGSAENDFKLRSKKMMKPLKLPKRSVDPASLLLRNECFVSISPAKRELRPITEKLSMSANDHLLKAPNRKISPSLMGTARRKACEEAVDLDLKTKKMLGLQTTSEKLSVSTNDELPKAPNRKISPSLFGTALRKDCEEAIDLDLDLATKKMRELQATSEKQSVSATDEVPRAPFRKFSPSLVGTGRRKACEEAIDLDLATKKMRGLQTTSEELSVSTNDQLPKAPRRKMSPYPIATCPRKQCEEGIGLDNRTKSMVGLQTTSEKLSGPTNDQLPKLPDRRISIYPMATCPRKACEEAIDTVLGMQSICDASPILPRRKISSNPINGSRARSA
jgi:hypothetical protein